MVHGSARVPLCYRTSEGEKFCACRLTWARHWLDRRRSNNPRQDHRVSGDPQRISESLPSPLQWSRRTAFPFVEWRTRGQRIFYPSPQDERDLDDSNRKRVHPGKIKTGLTLLLSLLQSWRAVIKERSALSGDWNSTSIGLTCLRIPDEEKEEARRRETILGAIRWCGHRPQYRRAGHRPTRRRESEDARLSQSRIL